MASIALQFLLPTHAAGYRDAQTLVTCLRDVLQGNVIAAVKIRVPMSRI